MQAPLFSDEELEAHNKEVTQEGQILASGQAGASSLDSV